MVKEETQYLSFLLRLWLADGDGGPVRRVALESPLTGERKGFANLDELCSYLQQLANIEVEDVHEDSGQN